MKKIVFLFAMLLSVYSYAQDSLVVDNMEIQNLSATRSQRNKNCVGLTQSGNFLETWEPALFSYRAGISGIVTVQRLFIMKDIFDISVYFRDVEKELALFVFGKITFEPSAAISTINHLGFEWDVYEGKVLNSMSKRVKTYMYLITTVIQGERYVAYVAAYTETTKFDWADLQKATGALQSVLETFKVL